ncbi:MAG: DUF3581 domain-containing protein [Ectothiorhodospiraceae bacterium]|nr:DUF3581 domain-containing protein [Ectothiorhodospiraceae bacterium]
MFLDAFYTRTDGNIRISAEQASRFAKDVAGDFNPIHDADSRRFCVPGDLLFALVLANYGVSERMQFHFKGMVGDGVALQFSTDAQGVLDVMDDAGKVYLRVQRSGEVNRDPVAVEAFIRRYVAFSGKNFPHFMKPLMEQEGVMFNPDRPLVIYDSMGFELQGLQAENLDMELARATMDVQGKRAESVLDFRISAGERDLGRGSKKLLVSGLRPYDEDRLQRFIAEFTERMKAYRAGEWF